MRKPLLTFLTALMAVFTATASPVHKRTVQLIQPDGSIFSAILDGDEFFHTLTDLQGHLIVKDRNGAYCYAAISADGSRRSSGFEVGKPAPAHILAASSSFSSFRLRPSVKRSMVNAKIAQDGSILKRMRNTAPVTKASAPMNKHCIILLVEFKDKKMHFSRDNFVAMVKQKGYSAAGANGSVNDYFNDQFQGDVEFSYEISDVITLDKDCAWYFGDNSEDDIDIRSDMAVAEACVKAHEAGVDFSVCDDDNDGEVDNVFLFVAGRDQAECGDADCVWSHMFYLESSSNKDCKYLTLDGKRINNYAISTEYRDDKSFTSIGTFCHEYSHALGLMDLYDTDYAGSGGYGNGLWYTTGLMDGGNMNNNYNTPPHYNAIDYDLSGIGNPEPLVPGKYTLEPIDKNRRYLKMETGTKGEFYLIECRNNTGWDRYIGGKGLLIYHIDMSNQDTGWSDVYSCDWTAYERWIYNEVNCRPDRQCAQLISATPGARAYTSDGYLKNNVSSVFYPYQSYDAFSPLTSPAFVFWDGTESPLAITDIRLSGSNVTFTVSKMSGVTIPEVVLENTEIFQDAAIIQWAADDNDYEGDSYLAWGKSNGEQEILEVKPYEKGRYAVVLDGLSSMTAYKATIYFKDAGVSSTEIPVNFTTKRLYDGYPFIFLNNVARNDDGSFPAGSMVPLRVYNSSEAESVEWYFGNSKVSVGADGYYHIGSSGKLKAVIRKKDGSTDVLMKEIKIR